MPGPISETVILKPPDTTVGRFQPLSAAGRHAWRGSDKRFSGGGGHQVGHNQVDSGRIERGQIEAAQNETGARIAMR